MPQNIVVASYRYLRLAILVVVATLFAALVIERWVDGCELGSISAYYHSPVHSVFVGSLMALGVVMIALKGADELEDQALNIAGALAPIVALVPTSQPSEACITEDVLIDADALVTNNIPALGIGLVLALGLALVIAWRRGRTGRPQRPAVIGLVISGVLIAAGVIWYVSDKDSFLEHAHGTTAVAMFVFIWIAVMANAGWPKPVLRWIYAGLGVAPNADDNLMSPTLNHLRFRTWYRVVAVFMPVAAVAILAIVRSDTVFWLEVAEIAGFAAFWGLQTAEGWDTGRTNPGPAPTTPPGD